VEVVRDALPDESDAVPIFCEPSKKVTVPLGEDVPVVALTSAVSVSAEPRAMLLDDAVSVVAVPYTSGMILIEIVLELEAVKTDVPEKVALTEAVPVGSAEVVSVALPADNTAVPILMEPL
jgi:hypothetical protein